MALYWLNWVQPECYAWKRHEDICCKGITMSNARLGKLVVVSDWLILWHHSRCRTRKLNGTNQMFWWLLIGRLSSTRFIVGFYWLKYISDFTQPTAAKWTLTAALPCLSTHPSDDFDGLSSVLPPGCECRQRLCRSTPYGQRESDECMQVESN